MMGKTAVGIADDLAPGQSRIALWPADNKAPGRIAVSYTHLDVYKRQLLGRGLGKRAFLPANDDTQVFDQLSPALILE